MWNNILLENELTKGSQRVLANNSIVQNLADAVRDDARAHPHNFPPGSMKTFQKAKDEDVAKWFLEQIDNIEKRGYEGTIYSRDGSYNEWIVRRYISGSHNWEDLIGVMNMNLRDWTILKNRGMLDPKHTDIPKFNSVRDIGKYMSTHYHDKLKDIRDAAALAAVKKQAKLAKIVDNDDYKIYTVFNWAGARTIGNGTQWCTANSSNDINYKSYSKHALLFQLFPKNPEMIDKTGTVVRKHTKGPEKYQFDAGSGSFNDIADDRADSIIIRKKFPYLYDDLVNGLEQNKQQLQAAIDTMASDESMNDNISKVNHYDIDKEIKKLGTFKGTYFTDKKRPEENTNQEVSSAQDVEQPQIAHEPQQPQGNPQMENVDKDVAAMLQSLRKYDKLVESVAPVLGMVTLGEKKDGKPEWLEKVEKKAEGKTDKDEVEEGVVLSEPDDEDEDEDDKPVDKKEVNEKDEGKHNNGKTTGFKVVAKKAAAEYGSKEAGEKVAGAVRNKMKTAGKLEEANELADPDVLAWMKRFASLG